MGVRKAVSISGDIRKKGSVNGDTRWGLSFRTWGRGGSREGGERKPLDRGKFSVSQGHCISIRT